MAEQSFDTSFYYYDYGSCKCDSIKRLKNEISSIDNAVPKVEGLRKAYDSIHQIYTDILNSTKASLYIKAEQIDEIETKMSYDEEEGRSNLVSCINNLDLSMSNKETRKARFRRMDDRYHDRYR